MSTRPSGNPGGRPKLELSVREVAQQYSIEALETLVHVMRTGKPGDRITAANAVLDRAYGRPKQSVEMSGSGVTLVDLLVSLNNSHAVDGEPEADRTDGGNDDADLASGPD
jgi:hypothetical protein